AAHSSWLIGYALPSPVRCPHIDSPSESGGPSSVTCCAWARMVTTAMSAQRTRATASRRWDRRLRIAVPEVGMEDRQGRAHEIGDAPLRRDATHIEVARELRIPNPEQSMHVADMFEL